MKSNILGYMRILNKHITKYLSQFDLSVIILILQKNHAITTSAK